MGDINRIQESWEGDKSKVINQPLDSAIENRALSFETDSKEQQSHSQAEIENAISLVDDLIVPAADPYQNMSLKEAKLARLGIACTTEE